MWWKSDFPYALFLRQTLLRSLTEENGGKTAPTAAPAWLHRRVFFFSLGFFLSFHCIYDLMFFSRVLTG